jgi:hypothetical protein
MVSRKVPRLIGDRSEECDVKAGTEGEAYQIRSDDDVKGKSINKARGPEVLNKAR